MLDCSRVEGQDATVPWGRIAHLLVLLKNRPRWGLVRTRRARIKREGLDLLYYYLSNDGRVIVSVLKSAFYYAGDTSWLSWLEDIDERELASVLQACYDQSLDLATLNWLEFKGTGRGQSQASFDSSLLLLYGRALARWQQLDPGFVVVRAALGSYVRLGSGTGAREIIEQVDSALALLSLDTKS